MSSMNLVANSQRLPGLQESVTPVSAGKTANTGPAASGAAGQPGVETASLSAAGGALASMLPTSDARMDRVKSLQQSINAGTYNVSASDVAGKMMHTLPN